MLKSMRCPECGEYLAIGDGWQGGVMVTLDCKCGAILAGQVCRVCQGTGWDGNAVCGCEMGLEGRVRVLSGKAGPEGPRKPVFGEKG